MKTFQERQLEEAALEAEARAQLEREEAEAAWAAQAQKEREEAETAEKKAREAAEAESARRREEDERCKREGREQVEETVRRQLGEMDHQSHLRRHMIGYQSTGENITIETGSAIPQSIPAASTLNPIPNLASSEPEDKPKPEGWVSAPRPTLGRESDPVPSTAAFVQSNAPVAAEHQAQPTVAMPNGTSNGNDYEDEDEEQVAAELNAMVAKLKRWKAKDPNILQKLLAGVENENLPKPSRKLPASSSTQQSTSPHANHPPVTTAPSGLPAAVAVVEQQVIQSPRAITITETPAHKTSAEGTLISQAQSQEDEQLPDLGRFPAKRRRRFPKDPDRGRFPWLRRPSRYKGHSSESHAPESPRADDVVIVDSPSRTPELPAIAAVAENQVMQTPCSSTPVPKVSAEIKPKSQSPNDEQLPDLGRFPAQRRRRLPKDPDRGKFPWLRRPSRYKGRASGSPAPEQPGADDDVVMMDSALRTPSELPVALAAEQVMQLPSTSSGTPAPKVSADIQPQQEEQLPDLGCFPAQRPRQQYPWMPTPPQYNGWDSGSPTAQQALKAPTPAIQTAQRTWIPASRPPAQPVPEIQPPHSAAPSLNDTRVSTPTPSVQQCLEKPQRAQSQQPALPAPSTQAVAQTRPELAQRTNMWPEARRLELAEAACVYINGLQPNAARPPCRPSFIMSLIERNPTYVEICGLIESSGYYINRVHFARHLLKSVPNISGNNVDQASPAPNGPSESEKTASAASQTPPLKPRPLLARPARRIPSSEQIQHKDTPAPVPPTQEPIQSEPPHLEQPLPAPVPSPQKPAQRPQPFAPGGQPRLPGPVSAPQITAQQHPPAQPSLPLQPKLPHDIKASALSQQFESSTPEKQPPTQPNDDDIPLSHTRPFKPAPPVLNGTLQTTSQANSSPYNNPATSSSGFGMLIPPGFQGVNLHIPQHTSQPLLQPLVPLNGQTHWTPVAAKPPPMSRSVPPPNNSPSVTSPATTLQPPGPCDISEGLPGNDQPSPKPGAKLTPPPHKPASGSKGEKARKRNVGEIVDSSILNDNEEPNLKSPRIESSDFVREKSPRAEMVETKSDPASSKAASVQSEASQQLESTKQKSTSAKMGASLKRSDTARPITKARALRKSNYDPRTIARDVLVNSPSDHASPTSTTSLSGSQTAHTAEHNCTPERSSASLNLSPSNTASSLLICRLSARRKAGSTPPRIATATDTHSPQTQDVMSPAYAVYACHWQHCDAKLHNFPALRRHLLRVHAPADGGERETACCWDTCGGKWKTFSRKEMTEHLDRHVSEVALVKAEGPSAA